MNVVLFACVHNAGRSQMAAAWFNHLADRSKASALSAGTRPAAAVHAEVVRVMTDAGLDAHLERPRRLTPELARTATLLITMGCGEDCPVVPGIERDDWPIEDPKGRSRHEVAAISDGIRRRVERLLRERGWMLPGELT